jgi:signal transduction histidine kinase
MKTKIQLLLQRLMKTGDGKTIVNDEAKAALDRRTALEETGILAAAIEHDIKTPLAILRLITRRMSDRFASQPDVLRGVEEINQQLHRIYAVVDIVPLLSKGTDFKRQIVKANLCDLVNRCIKDLKQQGATRGVFFRQDQQTFFVSAD